MIGTIQAARPSKSGKTLSIQIDGKWYQSKLWQLQQAVGRKIAAETSDSDYNGQTVHWLNSFSFADADPVGVATHAVMVSQAAGISDRVLPARPVASGTVPGAAISPGAVSPYQPLVSNLAAHLIAAGKEPADLASWFQACRDMLEGWERMPGEDDVEGTPY